MTSNLNRKNQLNIFCSYLFCLNLLFAIFSDVLYAKSSTNNDCNQRNVAESIIHLKSVIPTKLYHFGRRKVLEKDIEANTIPLDDWNRYIMGNESRNSHKPERRGLYVTSGIDTNGWGHENNAFSLGNNWLIEIEIQDECRQPNRVASLLGLLKDIRFTKWFEKNLTFGGRKWRNLNDFANQCFGDGLNFEGFETEACSLVVTKFLEDENIGIMLDEQILKSFYIRDRQCIKNIKGKPEEFIDILATETGLWKSTCELDLTADYMPYYLAQGLMSSKELDSQDILKISANSNLLKNKGIGSEVRKMLENYVECKEVKNLKKFRKTLESMHLKSGAGQSFSWEAIDCSR